MIDPHSPSEPLSLRDTANHILDECRMVLPGIQALFGFQLIAVFNDGFANRLTPLEQRIHLLAIVSVLIAITLVMAPAALHRQREPRGVSESFVRVASGLLLGSMPPLAVGIALDVALVSRLILGSPASGIAVGAGALLLLLGTWFGLVRFRGKGLG
jgi:hypothetical protein